MKTGLKILSLGICTAVLAGCVSMDNYNDTRTSSNITNDAVRLNDAFNRSTNSVILKNVLRARDRWTVNFTTLSGIKSRPTSSRSGSAGFGPLGLGNAVGPFTDSKVNVGMSSGSLNEYNINPFANHENSQSLLAPTSFGVFKGYYESGWPKDVAFLLFVRSLETNVNNSKFILHNAGDNYAEFKTNLEQIFAYKPGASFDLKTDLKLKTGSSVSSQCGSELLSVSELFNKVGANFENIEKFKSVTGGSIKIADRGHSGNGKMVKISVCPPSETEKNSFVLSEIGQRKSSLTQDRIDKLPLEFRLRSFEDIIYYLGEVERVNPADRPMASSPCNSRPGPIFAIHQNEPNLTFGASVHHEGRTYSVLPQYGYYCFPERTSTTMSILNQLLLLNQSEEFLKAPQSFFD